MDPWTSARAGARPSAGRPEPWSGSRSSPNCAPRRTISFGVVAAVTAYDDQDAAAAVAALEHMLIDRGLMTPEQVEADVLAHRTTRAHARR